MKIIKKIDKFGRVNLTNNLLDQVNLKRLDDINLETKGGKIIITGANDNKLTKKEIKFLQYLVKTDIPFPDEFEEEKQKENEELLKKLYILEEDTYV